MSNFNKKANVVIIGQGGIVGASVVHHLIARSAKITIDTAYARTIAASPPGGCPAAAGRAEPVMLRARPKTGPSA